MFDSEEEKDDAEVQMAPLIDCVFLLLIFFLVSSTLKKIEKELPLELPEASATVIMPRTDELLIISVDRYGKIYKGTEPLTQDSLHRIIRKAVKTNPNQRVRIDGDRATPFQHIVYIMDICQFEGLRNVGVHVADEKKSKK